MAGENVGAERRRQKNHEVGNLYTCFRSSSSLVTNLVTEQPVRALRHCESGTSVVQVCVPEFDAVISGCWRKRGDRRYHAGQ